MVICDSHQSYFFGPFNNSINMSNPFDELDDDNGEILEGFLCPICRADLKSVEFLTKHFETAHAEEQDALKSVFKDIFAKAKKKIRLNFDDGSAELSRNFEKNANISRANASIANYNSKNARTAMNVYNFMDHQEVGVSRDHLEYFQSIRNPRLERYASETNKLIIRLHKLVKDMPSDPVLRKQHEKNIVTWLDGSSVKLCPSCAKSFHIARRQHHCRLCGSIMCDDCSRFMSMETAMELASLTTAHSESGRQAQATIASAVSNAPTNNIRSCDHCLWLLEARQEMHESRTVCPPITQVYSEIQQLRLDVKPDIEMYLKIIGSLYEGESIFKISDASALRGKIGQVAEAIDVRSKRILALFAEPGSRAESLKKSIRLSCIQLIKEKMLALPPLPEEQEIRRIQERKRMETEQRIETERRKAMEAYERSLMESNSANEPVTRVGGNDYVQESDLRSMDTWIAPQVSSVGAANFDDPLVEQINIIKSYIKQARQEMNFEVVETLELNLRELQREFYERQRSSARSNAEARNESSSNTK